MMLRAFSRPFTSSIPRTNLPKPVTRPSLLPPPHSQTRKMTSNLSSNALFDVSNQTAVVTGGGTGIGLMITQALVANGAKVYITGRRKDKLDNVVSQHAKGPGKIVALPGDISSKDSLKKLADDLAAQEPAGIHLLVNNAGIARDDSTKYASNGGQPDLTDADAVAAHLWRSEFGHWEETFRTNVAAQYFASAAFLPLLAKGRGLAEGFSPLIVNVASISGVLKGSSGGQFAYGASKAAFLQLTRSLATTFLDCRVRVNCIAPGVFPSEMTTGGSDADNKSRMERKATNPAKRFGSETDMGACILYLAGPGGTFLNSQVIYPDGGVLLVSGATA